MTNAPSDPYLRNAIRKVVDDPLLIEHEAIAFLGREGEIRRVSYPGDPYGELQKIRMELLGKQMLGAIVHLRIRRTGQGRVHVAEIYKNPDQPTLHTIVSRPGTPAWIEDSTAMEIWQEEWNGEEVADS